MSRLNYARRNVINIQLQDISHLCPKQVQKAAVDLVEGLTGSVDGLEQLMSHSGSLLPALLRLIAGDRDISKTALNCLINLSQV